MSWIERLGLLSTVYPPSAGCSWMSRERGKHPFHSLCSYVGSFPPDLAHVLITELVESDGPILDPFCGSGTTLLEAKTLGLRSIGVDLNPLAVALARAKVTDVGRRAVLARLMELARDYHPPVERIRDGEPIRIIFHDRTLRQLMYLKGAVQWDRPEDRFLVGALLGVMHGKFRQDGTTQYLSIDMPNTFSMSPAYVRSFVEEHGLEKKPIDVFGKLRDRVNWLFREGSVESDSSALVCKGDAALIGQLWHQKGLPKAGAIITSPPYLKVLRYGTFNWIRLWFLGYTAQDVDGMLDTTSSIDKYLSFMASFLLSVSGVLCSGAPVALVLGDIDRDGHRINLAELIREELTGLIPLKYMDTIEDEFDVHGKTTRIWGDAKKGEATKQDRILVLIRE